ncbi:MAG: hypothetical protein QOG20_5520 [Pseudonocardiales bacterium]|nr:hypothetical protein [Pseudonocardiales bacterium]
MRASAGQRPPADRPGAQGERTRLAWERSALSPLATAGLLLFKHVGPPFGRVLLVAADILLAVVVLWSGRRRDRRICSLRTARSARTTVSDAGREVVGAAVAATAIALGTAVFIAWA